MKTTLRQKAVNRFYALAKRLQWSEDERKAQVLQSSNNEFTSVSKFYSSSENAFANMLNDMQHLANQKGGDADKWRKRCIAAVSGWLDESGNTVQGDRLEYIKSIVCRTSQKDKSEFNNLTISQLRTAYNSFCKQTVHLQRTKSMGNLLTNQNLN